MNKIQIYGFGDYFQEGFRYMNMGRSRGGTGRNFLDLRSEVKTFGPTHESHMHVIIFIPSHTWLLVVTTFLLFSIASPLSPSLPPLSLSLSLSLPLPLSLSLSLSFSLSLSSLYFHFWRQRSLNHAHSLDSDQTADAQTNLCLCCIC